MTIYQNSLSLCQSLSMANSFEGKDFGSFYAFKSGINAAWANFVAGRGQLSLSEIDDIINFFDHTPFCWSVNLKDQELVLNVGKAGLRKIDTTFEMNFGSTNFRDLSNKEYKVVKVNDGYSFILWLDVIAESFGFNRTNLEEFHQPVFRERGAEFEFYFAIQGKKPISALCLFRSKAQSEIHSVGTLTEFRKKGAASHLVSTILKQEMSMGKEVVSVETRIDNVNFFKKLGFTTEHEYMHVIKQISDQNF